MSAAVDAARLPAILTDADWAQGFAFYGADTTTAEDLTGSTFSLVLAPVGRAHPAAGDVYELTTAGGAISLATNVVSVYAAQAAIAAWKPGTYQVELRRFYGVGLDEALYVGTVFIAEGLSQLAAMGGAPVLAGGGDAGVEIFRDAGLARVVRGEASGEAAVATIEADAAHADRLVADADLTTVAADTTATHADKLAADTDATGAHADRLTADADLTTVAADTTATHADKLAADGDAAAAHADRLLDDADQVATHADKLAADLDASGAHTDRLQADSDAATSTAQAGIATTQAGIATAQASAAAASAAAAASNTTATLIDIMERVAIFDPAATPAQVAATAARGVTNLPAASAGGQYFRIGLLTSTALTGVATFTRTTTRTAIDADGTISSFGAGVPAVLRNGLHATQASTNLILQSQALDQLSGTPWSNIFTAVTANNQTAPDGTSTADTLLEDTTVGQQHRIEQAITFAAAAYTLSVFAKPAGRSWLQLRIAGNGAFFNLSGAGSIGTLDGGVTATIQPLANGWYRCAITFTPTAGASFARLNIATGDTVNNYTGATLGLALWGAQLEQLGISTAYMPTTTAAVTRNADVAQETVSVPKGQAFTIVGKMIAPPDIGLANRFCELWAAANTGDGLILYYQGTAFRAQFFSGGLPATANLQSAAIAGGAPIGFALSIAGDLATWSVNGAVAASVTLPGGAFAQALTRLAVGCSIGGANQANTTIRERRVLDRALSGAECATFSDVSLEWNLDFTTQTYQFLGTTYTGGLTDLPLTTFSRPSAANEVTVAGFILNVASGAIRTTDAGLTIEAATTNAALWNRDLTNAVWVGSNMTAAKDQAGVDGAANAASSITATAINATILQAITLASSQRAQSAYVKRITGAGVVSMTTDGGTTWTAIAVGANWAQVAIPAQTLANPQIGFKLATSGDKIAVDFVQNEGGASPTSPLATTAATASRSVEALSSLDSAPAAFSIVAKVTIPLLGGATGAPRIWQWDDGTTTNWLTLYYDRASGHLKLNVKTAGSGVDVLDLGAVAPGSTYAVAMAFAANDFAATVNGGAMVTSAASAIPAGLSTFRYGSQDAAGGQAWGPGLQKTKRWRGRRPNATLQADALAA